MEQKVTSTITKGLIIGAVMIAITLASYFSGTQGQSIGWVSYCVYFVGVIFCVWHYGKQIDHNSTFGNYFGHGFKVSAMVTLIMVLYLVIFISMNPEIKQKALVETGKALEAKKNLSQEEINRNLQMTKKFFMVFLIAATLLYNIIIGCIASLIGAAITKKHPRLLQEEHLNQTRS